MTKTQHFELQMVCQTLDTIDQQLAGPKPKEYISLVNQAQQAIGKLLDYADKNEAFFDHPFWNDALNNDVKAGVFFRQNQYCFKIIKNNGSLSLSIRTGIDHLVGNYTYYKSTKDIEEDIKTMMKKYSIRILINKS